jgi:hypothetical protein
MPETITLEEFGYGLGPEAITYEILWQTFAADACPKCQMLNGEKWSLKSLTGTLISQTQGAVYDLDADLPITHPHCRCYVYVVPKVDLENTEFFKELQKDLNEMSGDMPSNIEEAKNQVRDLGNQVDVSSRQMQTGINRSLGLVQKFTGNENIYKMTSEMQRAIGVAGQLERAMISLQVASGPLGWAFALLAGLTALASAGDLYYDATRGR